MGAFQNSIVRHLPVSLPAMIARVPWSAPVGPDVGKTTAQVHEQQQQREDLHYSIFHNML